MSLAFIIGAGDEIRTHDIYLGKVTLIMSLSQNV